MLTENPLIHFLTTPNTAAYSNLIKQPITYSNQADTFTSHNLTVFSTVSLEINAIENPTLSGSVTVIGNNSGGDIGESLGTFTFNSSQKKYCLNLPNFGYSFIVLKFVGLTGSLTDIIIVAKR